MAQQMSAMVIDQFGGVEKLHLTELERPTPNRGEVQIKVAYAGVNPVDWKIREGYFKDRMPHEWPIVLGWEAAGVVSQVGPGVTDLKEGEQVFAYLRSPKVHWGSFAEYVCFDAAHVVKIPSTLSLKEAAAIPLTALTAWQALFEAAELSSKETILILAGAGGVGGMAIQLARYKGARVVTTASQKNHDYVSALGAEVAIDYQQGKVAEQIYKRFPQGVDVLFDCVGGSAVQEALPALKRGGRFVSIVHPLSEAEAVSRQIVAKYVFVRPEGKHLAQIATLFQQGVLKVPHIQEFALKEAPQVLEQLREGHTRGKYVLKVS